MGVHVCVYGDYVCVQDEHQAGVDVALLDSTSRDHQLATLDTLRQLHAVARPDLLVSHLKVGIQHGMLIHHVENTCVTIPLFSDATGACMKGLHGCT